MQSYNIIHKLLKTPIHNYRKEILERLLHPFLAVGIPNRNNFPGTIKHERLHLLRKLQLLRPSNILAHIPEKNGIKKDAL